MPVFIQDYAVICAQGPDTAAVEAAMFRPDPTPVQHEATLVNGRTLPVGRVNLTDESEAAHPVIGRSRTNRLLAAGYQQLAPSVEAAKARYGAARLGVVIGTCTSGLAEAGAALQGHLEGRGWPSAYPFATQELADPATAAVALSGAEGPAFVISTACTSGGKAIAAAARLILADLCDAVICGGVDTLCDLTLNGFGTLDALSPMLSNPFSRNRKGINLGEGAGLLLLSKDPSGLWVAGWGESSDAYHMNAPDPSGAGAEIACRKALAAGRLAPADIDYIHLHGTGTVLNDQMESGVINALFGPDTPCSSTKPLTGHTLGAAGACQAVFGLLAMKHALCPPHVWDGDRDPDLAPIRLADGRESQPLRRVLSCSYAFGGNNFVLALGRE